LIGTTVLNLSA